MEFPWGKNKQIVEFPHQGSFCLRLKNSEGLQRSFVDFLVGSLVCLKFTGGKVNKKPKNSRGFQKSISSISLFVFSLEIAQHNINFDWCPAV